MIILDAANKSLQLVAPAVGSKSVVSYWSVNTISNIWTLTSLEHSALSTTETILPAPSTNEIKVVKNLWIQVNGIGGVNLHLNTGIVQFLLHRSVTATGINLITFQNGALTLISSS